MERRRKMGDVSANKVKVIMKGVAKKMNRFLLL
jgi:hypothetical protein